MTHCVLQAQKQNGIFWHFLRAFSTQNLDVYSANRQQAENTLEGKLQEARDELAEIASCLGEAKRYPREAKARSGDEIEKLEEKIEQLEGANGVLVQRAEVSEKAAKAALSSGSAHPDVWDQSPATKEAQLMAIKEAGEHLNGRAFESDFKEAERMAEAWKRRGLSDCSVTLAGMVGLN